MYQFVVSAADSQKRLDLFVAQKLLLSRSFIAKLHTEGKILINEKVEKMAYKLKEGDVATIDFTYDTLKQIPKITLPVLYEDNDCIVINKPAGILTHSKGAYNPEATVATFIAPKLFDLSGDRAGIVHRLDRATSGVIICAKHSKSLYWLQKQFAQRKVKKSYLAIISGVLEIKEAIIDMPIKRDATKPKQFRVDKDGRAAQTYYKVLRSAHDYSELELHPITGRTHQLRVHLKQLGHPIVGDALYGGKHYKRLLLHAHKLEVTLPCKQRRVFTAAVPKEFISIMK